MALKDVRQLTPYLIFNVCVFLLGAILFGLDTGSFGSLQALPSFLNRFGQANGEGKFILPPTRKAVMNSLPWIGKIGGTLGSETIIERLGYKKTMYVVAAIQLVGVIIELTAHQWIQFTFGRIIAYIAVGIVENVVPSYSAEVSPAATRGLLSGPLMTVTGLGNLWGAGMSRKYATELDRKGWIIPTSMQLIPAVLILALVPLTPESPRWLMFKGRKESAKEVLDKIRPKHDVASGATAAEADVIEDLIKESLATESGSWAEVFKGNYLWRIWIASTVFIIQQTNGNQFIQSYAPSFYVQQGLKDMSFTYAIIGQVFGVVGCLVGLILFDISGRRPLFIWGSLVAAFLLYLASGVGSMGNLNPSQTNTMIACFVILPAFTRISATNCAFLTGAEIGGTRMRKKIMAIGLSFDVLAAFLVTFVTPYLMPSMGVHIGWIFGSVAAFSFVWGFLFFPELKGRSLEEVDELFAAKLKAWQFAKYETHGAGRLLAVIEKEGAPVSTKDIPIPSGKDVEAGNADVGVEGMERVSENKAVG